MRVIFINLQANGLLVKTARTCIAKANTPVKYRYLIDALCLDDNIEVLNYIDKEGITLIPIGMKNLYTSIFAYLEYLYVLQKNNLQKVKPIFNAKKIKDDDIVIGFIHGKGGCSKISEMKGKHFIHINQISEHSHNEMPKDKNLCGFIGEANLRRTSTYFCAKYSDIHSDFKILPYVVADRFKNIQPFEQRISKAIATGTIGKTETPEYIEYFGYNFLQKMRHEIFIHLDELQDEVNSLISEYSKKQIERYASNDSIIKKIRKSYNNFKNVGIQKKYFSVNIVESYNSHMFAVVPEEDIGLPAIGAFEAMACGCMFIGIDSLIYRDLGLIPNIHYAVYDGTIQGLKSTINYYQNHLEEAKNIATNGEKIVNQRFRVNKVKKDFLRLIG